MVTNKHAADESSEPISELLCDTVLKCLVNDGKQSPRLRYKSASHANKQEMFREWYRNLGTGYFFLFKKNLRVTNIQYAELLALIRVHTLERGTLSGKEPTFSPERQCQARELQFISSPDFHGFVDKMLQSFVRRHAGSRVTEESRSELKSVVKQYSRIFLNMIAFDAYFGSCVVYTPPTLELDLKAICAYSGYIHSCGAPIFVEKVNETEPEDLRRAIDIHSNRIESRPVRLVVYAHEEFSERDRAWEDEMKHGLDDVKLYDQKFFLGREPLIRAMKSLYKEKKKGGTKVIVCRSDGLIGKRKFDRSRSFWLIGDRSVGGDVTKPGDDRFFVCYEQRFKNCSPTHIFEENKPAWVSQTTIPHPLMAAMINITKPWWPETGNIVCADPFAGSGTTWFEAEKHPRVICRSSDLAPISGTLMGDNYELLSATATYLQTVVDRLKALIEEFKRTKDPAPDQLIQLLPETVRVLLRKHGTNGRAKGCLIPSSLLSLQSEAMDVKNLSLPERIIVYLARRSDVRHALGFESGRESWAAAFVTEAEKLRFQFEALIKLKKYKIISRRDDGITVIAGKFSEGCLIWPNDYEGRAREHPREIFWMQQNASEINEGHYDVIATDPPYGFNEDMTVQGLAKLHSSLFEKLIRALKNEGQIVIAVPDAALLGKAFPEFTTKYTVIRQILLSARKEKREAFRTAYSVPSPGELFEPPYYWDSGGSLTRAILHFRFRKCVS